MAESNTITKPRPKRLSATKQRNLVAQTIERLLDLLDAIDPDPEEEPSLGWSDGNGLYPQVSAEAHHSRAYGTGDDRELQCEDEGADDYTDN
jgi:hypothetical protein